MKGTAAILYCYTIEKYNNKYCNGQVQLVQIRYSMGIVRLKYRDGGEVELIQIKSPEQTIKLMASMPKVIKGKQQQPAYIDFPIFLSW